MTTVETAVLDDGETEQEKRAGFLELFFDLVFVFGITQVTALLLENTSAAGFLRAALVFGLLWWAWSAYAWLTNAIDIERSLVRLLILAAMAGSFFMALAVPEAYGSDGLWFAVPYAAVRVLQVVLYAEGLRRDPDQLRAFLPLAPWFLLSPALVLVGGAVDDPARAWLWAASLVIDVTGTLVANRGSGGGWRVSPAHFAERYGLFMIIVLGETIVATGLGAREIERDGIFVVSVIVAFAAVATLWWAYFGFTQRAAERTLASTPVERRGPLARDLYTLGHFPIALGIVFTAVAGEKTLAHPDDPLTAGGRSALGIGVGLFLLGFVLVRLRAIRRIAWERLLAGAVAVVLVVFLDGVAAVWLLALVVAVLVAMIAVERARFRGLLPTRAG